MKGARRVIVKRLAYTNLIAFVLVSSAALAQGTWERVPNGDADQSAPHLHGPDSNQVAQVGEMEVLNGPISFHTRNYLGFGLLARIRQNWQRALNEKGLVPRSEQKEFVIEFTILKDGSLDGRKLVESSGNAELDGTGLDAVAKSAPFMAIPEEFGGEYLKLRCHFYLNAGRRIRLVSRGAREAGSADTADNIPTAGKGTIHGDGGFTKPRLIYGPSPEFSEEARKAKVEGTIELKVTVDASGDVDDARVTNGLGSGLDEKAIEAVRKWKFKPGTKDGTPVTSEIKVDVSFRVK
jgi:TonB family protein